MSITKMIREKLEALRQEQGMILVRLNGPKPEVIQAIEENGGHILSRNYERWCHSDTCKHSAHSPGQEYTMVEVPAAWVEEGNHASSGSDVWDINPYDRVAMVIPSPLPEALVERWHGQEYASSTDIVGLLPHAAKVLTQPTD